MSKKASADEKPKQAIARQVVTPKRRYFMPFTGRSVEADTYADAVAKANKVNEKEGDGNI